MLSIPQSTSYEVVFKAYLSSDHVTEATGKTIAITIRKAGGAFGNPSAGATNATEISSGWYAFTLSTTDTNTIGPVAYRGAVATIDDVGGWLNVVSATTGGATNLDVAISASDDAMLAAIAALSIPTANANADALLDRAAGVETGLTPRQALRLMSAALFGKATGFDTGSVVYRDTGDTKNRISSAVTAAGRGAPTLDAS